MSSPRRRWSFTLRTLFVVMTLAIACAWFVPTAWTVYERTAFVRKITAAGGSATSFPKTSPGERTAWGSRAPLRMLFGDELMSELDVGEEPIDSTRLEDEAFRLFPELTQLSVHIPDEQLTGNEPVITLSCPVVRSSRAAEPELETATDEAAATQLDRP
jgi:hypothetical protein